MIKALFLVFLLIPISSFSIDTVQKTQESIVDRRIFVSMPTDTQLLMRLDMVDHLSSINIVLMHLASHDLNAAADTAETKLGLSSMGKHRNTGNGPGRYMPDGMRNIGRSMHSAASEFSNVARNGEIEDAYLSFQKIINHCVACHYSYRIQ